MWQSCLGGLGFFGLEDTSYTNFGKPADEMNSALCRLSEVKGSRGLRVTPPDFNKGFGSRVYNIVKVPFGLL